MKTSFIVILSVFIVVSQVDCQNKLDCTKIKPKCKVPECKHPVYDPNISCCKFCREGDTCPINEEHSECVDICKTCEILGCNCACNFLLCNEGCDCKYNFYRDSSGKCIPASECPTKGA